MKKYFLALTAAAFCILACSKENNASDQVEEKNIPEAGNIVSFSASVESMVDAETKASISTSDGSFTWSEGDMIAVQLTNNKFKTLTYSADKNEFSGSLASSEVIKDGGFAYFPASIAIDETPDSVNLSASTVSAPMVASVVYGSKELEFKYLGGFLSIRLDRVPVDAATLELSLPVTVEGTFAVSDGQISAVSSSSKVSVSVSHSTSATEIRIPVPVTTFTGGFTLNIKNASSEVLYTKTTSKSVAVGRANMKRMNELAVPYCIYVRNNATNWSSFQLYYYTKTGSYSSTWGTDELGSTSYTHNGNSYKRFEIPSSENGKVGHIVIHNYNSSDEKAVERVQIKDISINQDYYYSVNGDGEWRVYVCDGLNWSGGNLRAWKDGWECFTGVEGGEGPTENGTVTLMLEYYNNYTFKYWTGINSDDKFYYQFYKSDNSEQTPSYGISRPGSGQDIVFNAYYDGNLQLDLIGTGHVATYTKD